jgi:hypothetical protein
MELFKMKLDSVQKVNRKGWKKQLELNDGFIINQFGGTTMVVLPLGNDTAKVAFAMCHPNDKYNRKYGELIALQNLFSWARFCVVMPLSLVDVLAEELLNTDIV